MPNHVHLLWRIAEGFERENVQSALLSFTAHAFKKRLKQKKSSLLKNYYVDATDRDYQFWQREPMIKEVWTERFLLQKLNYIHNNPCQATGNLPLLQKTIDGHLLCFMKKIL